MSSNVVASSSLAVEKSAGLTRGARSPAFTMWTFEKRIDLEY